VDEKSPLGRKMLSLFEGRLRQFYQGQTQAHALGIIDQSRARRQFSDGQMSYTKIAGQEIVTLDVHPDIVELLSAEVRGGILPDWLLLEFVIEDGTRVASDFAAFARAPSWRRMDPAVGGASSNSNFGLGHWGRMGAAAYMRDDRLISGISPIGGAVAATQALTAGDPHRNTFVLDLRRLKQFPVISIDFYGWVTSLVTTPVIDYYERTGGSVGVTEDRSGYATWTYINGGAADLITASDIFTVGANIYTEEIAYLAAVTAEHIDGEIPPLTKATPDDYITWTLTGSYGAASGSVVGQSYTTNYDIQWVENIWHYSPVFVDVYSPRPLQVDVRQRVFSGGDLDWKVVRWLLSPTQDYRTWELLDRLPDGLDTSHMASPDVPNYMLFDAPSPTSDLETHYGRPYFGTYTLTLEEWSGGWGTPGAGP
jgi:hypothetical protein